MKGKRLLILGAAFALGISACAQATTMVRKNPLGAIISPDDSVTFSEKGYTNQQEIASVAVGDSTISFNKGSNSNAPKYFTSGSAIRIYGGGYFTVASSTKTIVAIDLVFGSSDGTNAITTNVGTFESPSWTGEASSVRFTVGGTTGNRRLAGVDIKYASDTPEPTLTGLSVDDGTPNKTAYFSGEQFDPTGLEIYAIWDGEKDTTNNLAPNLAWSPNPLIIGTTSVTAVYGTETATITGLSVTARATYSVAEAIAAVDGNTITNGVCVQGIISRIGSYNSSYHSITYWIIDEGVPGTELEVFGGKGLNNTNFNSVDDIKVGAEVTVCGDIKLYNSTYEFDSNNYLVSYSYTEPVETPTLTSLVVGGQYKTQFETNEAFSFGGTVTAMYSDGSSDDVTSDAVFSGYNMSTVGNQTVTVSYTDGETTKTATYAITVADPVVIPDDATTLVFSFADYASDNNISNGEKVAQIAVNSDVTLSAVGSDANTGKIYIKNDNTMTEWRFYSSGNGKLVITLAEGAVLYSAAGQVGTSNFGAASLVQFTVANNGVEYSSNANFNIKSLTIVYKPSGTIPVEPSVEEEINNTFTRASLTYSYNIEQNGTSDVLTHDNVNISGTTYKDWEDLSMTSGAVYSGNTAGDHNSIQFRSNNNNSGIVTTTSGGKAARIVIVWESHTADGRTVDVYGKNTAYTAASDLYGDNAGTPLGSIVKGTSRELVIDGDYAYIGIRSNSGALYMDSVRIEWDEPAEYSFSNVALLVGGFISQDLWDELDGDNHAIEGYGVIGAFAQDLGTSTIKGLYDEALDAGLTNIDEILEEEVCNGTTIRNFYTPLTQGKTHPAEASETQKVEQQVDVDDTYYVWSLRKNITDYSKAFSAIAYIRLADKLVFFAEVSTTAKQAGQSLINNGIYTGSAFDGSLGEFLK